MRWLAVLLCVWLFSCGGNHEHTANRPVARVEVVDWAGACDGEPRTRMERFRSTALAQDVHAATRAALEAWQPRGRDSRALAAPIAEDDLDEILPIVRRAIATCGTDEAVELTRLMTAFQTVAAIEDNPELPRMAAWLSEWASSAGLTFNNFDDNAAWEVELGGATDQRAVALVTHADVVPVNDPPSLIEVDAVPEGWAVPPFAASVQNGRLYGRGTEDDKGPIAAALVALAALRDAGYAPTEALLMVAGTGEEHDWDPMRVYASTAPRARHTISADAEYPVVVAESGFVAWGWRTPLGAVALPAAGHRATHGRRAADADPTYAVPVMARGGLFLTQVPDEAELIVLAHEPREVLHAARLAARAAVERFPDFEIEAGAELTTYEEQSGVRIWTRGVSVHSSTPEQGLNGLWMLAIAAQELNLMENGITRMLQTLRARFVGDHHGEHLGVATTDELMGPLVAAPTVFRVEEGEVRLRINLRRPRPMTADDFRAVLDEALTRVQNENDSQLEVYGDTYVGEPHVVAGNPELITTLLEIYREERSDPLAQPLSIRGGTYARLFEGAVSFGPSFPDRRYSGHGADEFIGLDALGAATRMYLEAYVRLSR